MDEEQAVKIGRIDFDSSGSLLVTSKPPSQLLMSDESGQCWSITIATNGRLTSRRVNEDGSLQEPRKGSLWCDESTSSNP